MEVVAAPVEIGPSKYSPDANQEPKTYTGDLDDDTSKNRDNVADPPDNFTKLSDDIKHDGISNDSSFDHSDDGNRSTAHIYEPVRYLPRPKHRRMTLRGPVLQSISESDTNNDTTAAAASESAINNEIINDGENTTEDISTPTTWTKHMDKQFNQAINKHCLRIKTMAAESTNEDDATDAFDCTRQPADQNNVVCVEVNGDSYFKHSNEDTIADRVSEETFEEYLGVSTDDLDFTKFRELLIDKLSEEYNNKGTDDFINDEDDDATGEDALTDKLSGDDSDDWMNDEESYYSDDSFVTLCTDSDEGSDSTITYSDNTSDSAIGTESFCVNPFFT